MSTNGPDAPEVAPEHAGLVDDATLLEPPSGAGVASLADAVARHRQRLTPGGLVGSLVVPDPMLPALADLLSGASSDPLALTVVVSGGAGGIEPASQWASRIAGARLRTLSTTLRDLDDLAGAARRTTAAAEQTLAGLDDPDATHVSVGLPLEGVGRPGWLAALDEVAMADLTVSFRTAGQGPALAPAVVEAVDAALDREVAIRFTGPNHAVTGFDPEALLLAVRLVLDGEADEARAVLAGSADLHTVRADLGSDALARVRRWLPSVEARLS
ncbi:hypothetical protein G7072_04395 [Nocardioides sp. HDW12B]|uniref:hypothetical protein n=1 Tax=Nocardioides sp. HDW12B TaxID=2714939 RepID=UPI00140E310C|nr:hypothetical protein [Nocardioides sp. HDW12B]QIK65681.1 hypothetical protein G7072_04395 [Nocardioides sp. HDW12B]